MGEWYTINTTNNEYMSDGVLSLSAKSFSNYNRKAYANIGIERFKKL